MMRWAQWQCRFIIQPPYKTSVVLAEACWVDKLARAASRTLLSSDKSNTCRSSSLVQCSLKALKKVRVTDVAHGSPLAPKLPESYLGEVSAEAHL